MPTCCVHEGLESRLGLIWPLASSAKKLGSSCFSLGSELSYYASYPMETAINEQYRFFHLQFGDAVRNSQNELNRRQVVSLNVCRDSQKRTKPIPSFLFSCVFHLDDSIFMHCVLGYSKKNRSSVSFTHFTLQI